MEGIIQDFSAPWRRHTTGGANCRWHLAVSSKKYKKNASRLHKYEPDKCCTWLRFTKDCSVNYRGLHCKEKTTSTFSTSLHWIRSLSDQILAERNFLEFLAWRQKYGPERDVFEWHNRVEKSDCIYQTFCVCNMFCSWKTIMKTFCFSTLLCYSKISVMDSGNTSDSPLWYTVNSPTWTLQT